MPTVEASGSQLAVIGTEHSLTTITLSRVLQFVVDIDPLVNDDELELRCKVKAASAGVAREFVMGPFKHDQGSRLAVSPPIISPYSFEATLKQVAGTGRTFDWYVASP